MRPIEPRSAAKRLSETLQQSKKLFSQLSDQSRKAAESGTSTLCGMLGGFLGTGLAYAAPFYTSATFLGLAPICAGLGIVIGVLAFRGPARFRLEAKIEMHQRALDALLEQIRRLPRNTPEYVRVRAWENYTRMLSMSPAFQGYGSLPLPPAPSSQIAHRDPRGD